MMRELDLLQAPLSGINLIEAGAGTGKTYTISSLYLRLVLELELPVEQILVVTYTRAATAELRERIRSRLLEAQAGLLVSDSRDQLITELSTRLTDRERAGMLLRRALLDFDRAAIHTIHGFCQRALADSAFESAAPFHAEMLLDEQVLLQEIVEDFWRIELHQADKILIEYLINQSIGVDSLSRFLRGKLSRPYLVVRQVAQPVDLAGLRGRRDRVFGEVQACWRSRADEITSLLLAAEGLNKARYKPAARKAWLELLDAYLAEDPAQPFEAFRKFTRSELRSSVNKGCSAPAHPFFDMCEQLLQAADALTRGLESWYFQMLGRLIDYANGELSQRKAAQRLLAYDDLLLHLHRALSGADGDSLVSALRRRYRAALIDEFQDTDPLQYAIFGRIFTAQGAPLYLVGDPKQAIYSFRGADIFAYLQARQAADDRFTLLTNWRSDPGIISVVNALFDRSGSFLFPEIAYHPAVPADRPRTRLVDPQGPDAPVQLGYLPEGLTKDQANALVVEQCAAQIARLLADDVRLDGRLLQGGDIAVLVRSHRQGERVREGLLRQGVNSAQRTQESVFHSWEAQELEWLLKAIVQPQRTPLLLSALGTDLLGRTAREILALADDEGALEEAQLTLLDCQRVWHEHGFMPMFRHLLETQSVPQRLLGLERGERRLTNLFQLAELVHRRERESRTSPEGLIEWLVQHRLDEQDGEEEHQLRLESDSDLVQIVTVHKSKGLQYPVVFIPFAWDGGLHLPKSDAKRIEPYIFHDPDEDYRPTLELGSERLREDLLHARREEMAEGLRLLYVALTRAEHRCHLYWGKVRGAEESAFGWLFEPPLHQDAVMHMKEHLKSLSNNEILEKLNAISINVAGALRILPVAPGGIAAMGGGGVERAERSPRQQFRVYSRGRLPVFSITSFSALVQHGGDVEAPDRDTLGAVPPPAEVPLPDAKGRDIHDFPRGARAGSCLHAIFEELDFTAAGIEGVQVLSEARLQAYGFDTAWTEVVSDMVCRVLETPLLTQGGLRLSQVGPADKLVELPFHYPVAGLDGRSLGRLLREHGMAGERRMEQALRRLRFPVVNGIMKGYIDLVFRHQGRYYLLDYKSNWLGGQQQAYDQPALARAMADEGYYLQYLLYTLALHRHLRLRLPDYRYEEHFGGVFYLFLRGMNPQQGCDQGVYHARPAVELIEALDRLIGGIR